MASLRRLLQYCRRYLAFPTLRPFKGIPRPRTSSSRPLSSRICLYSNSPIGRSVAITKRRPAHRLKTPPKSWNKEQYIDRLERLIAGFERYETLEESKRVLQAHLAIRISHPDAEIQNDEKRIDRLLSEQDSVALKTRLRLQAVQKDLDELAQAVKIGRRTLPLRMVEDLWSYKRLAKVLTKQDSPDNDAAIDVVKAKILMARGRQHTQKGWRVTDGYLQHLLARQATLMQNKAVKSICQTQMLSQVRKICQLHAPSAIRLLLKDYPPKPLDQNRNTPTGKEEWQLDDSDKGDLQIVQEWNAIRKKLRARQEQFHQYRHPDYHRKRWLEYAAQVGSVTQEDLWDFNDRYFSIGAQGLERLEALEADYKTTRSKAMRAGLEPPLSDDSELGVFSTHALDGAVGTESPEEKRIRFENNRPPELEKGVPGDPVIEAWLDALSDDGEWSVVGCEVEDFLRPEDSFSSAWMRADKRRRVDGWREAVER